MRDPRPSAKGSTWNRRGPSRPAPDRHHNKQRQDRHLPASSRRSRSDTGKYTVSLHEVNPWDPYTPLRTQELDVLLNWLVVDQNDLTTGPPVAHYDRVLAVASGHRLAGRMSVSLEDLVDEEFFDPPASFPVELADAVIPPCTPSGRPLRRTFRGSGSLMWAAVARGRIVHPITARSIYLSRDDMAAVPITDLPPLPLGLVWPTAHDSAQLRTLADLARALGPESCKSSGAITAGVGPRHAHRCHAPVPQARA